MKKRTISFMCFVDIGIIAALLTSCVTYKAIEPVTVEDLSRVAVPQCANRKPMEERAFGYTPMKNRMALIAEGPDHQKPVLLSIGQSIYYGTYRSRKIAYGQIASINDTALSVHTRVRGHIQTMTITFRQVKTIVVPDKGFIDFGNVTFVYGSVDAAQLLLIPSGAGTPSPQAGFAESIHAGVLSSSLPVFLTGAVTKLLQLGKTMNFSKGWAIRPILLPADDVHMQKILRSDEVEF